MDYKLIWVPFLGLFIAQTIKFVIETIKFKRIRFTRLLNGSGGMPSTHSTFITTLTTSIFLSEGLDSPVFAVAFIFSCVIYYDAIGVRWETGRQANTINRLVGVLNLKEGIHEELEEFRKLKEEVGHKPLEVIGGIILGVITAICFF